MYRVSDKKIVYYPVLLRTGICIGTEHFTRSNNIAIYEVPAMKLRPLWKASDWIVATSKPATVHDSASFLQSDLIRDILERNKTTPGFFSFRKLDPIMSDRFSSIMYASKVSA